ncbi:MAG: alpha/beta hydrolase, partial [Verrucomicrobiota bacterium]
TVIRDIQFATVDGIPLKLDLYRPESLPEGPLPTVLWIHGGGWLKGSKDRCKADFLAQHGFAVASVEYRLTDVAQWPAQIDDCTAAVRWVRNNHSDYHLDPNALGAWGGSAGGHLAALMGTRPGPEEEEIRVEAVCDWYGPTNLLTMPPNVVSETRTYEQVSQSNGAKLLGAPVPDVPEIAKDASALHQISPDDAPFLIMHGSEDPGVPLEQSTLFHKALKEAGVESNLVILEGAGHGGKEFMEEDVQEQIVSFFRKHLQ